LARGTGQGDPILVAFGIDERFACHLAVTITSIIETAPTEHFRFIIIHGGLSDETQRKVESCAPKQDFVWHQVSDHRLLRLTGHGYISQATYYRLHLPEVAPADACRLIYLDCDIVVCRSLRDLWESDLNGRAVGAVFDAGLDPIAFARKYNLPERRLGYFNAGILLLDIARIRKENLFAPIFDFLANCDEEPQHHDQDLLNITFWDNWASLHPMWNVQRKLLLRSSGPCYPEDHDLPAERRPFILHYTEQWKPWCPGTNHPYMWSYFRVAKRTPYWEEILKASKASRVKRLKWWVKHAMLRLIPGRAYEPRRSIDSWRAAGNVES